MLDPCATPVLRSRAARQGADRDRGGRADRRARHRARHHRPLVVVLETWLREQRAKLSRQRNVATAIAYSLTRFLDDGCLCMSNNATDRGVRPVAIGRKNWTFARSDRGSHRTAAIYTGRAEAPLRRVTASKVAALQSPAPSLYPCDQFKISNLGVGGP